MRLPILRRKCKEHRHLGFGLDATTFRQQGKVENYNWPQGAMANTVASDSSYDTLEGKLASFKHLDDYEYYKNARIKHNVMISYKHIMQSIKAKYKDTSQLTSCDDETDSDISEEPDSKFFDFNQILKRHKRRVKHDLSHHRR